jgi:hypothetical protein
MYEAFGERLRKSREALGVGDARIEISHERATGLWHWVLQGQDSGPIACNAIGFKTRELLAEDLRRVQLKAPKSLIFDLIGNLQAIS